MEGFHPLVSCVIPVFNAEKYLEQGLQSLLSQTYDNLEIILVDDHSTDGSWGICKKYSEEYSNILVFRNVRNSGGPLRGRERGIKEAHGEWITFMDCDDYVLPSYIEHLIDATDDGRYDISVTGHSRLFPNGTIESFTWNDYGQSRDERLTIFYEHFLKHDFWTDPTDTVGQNLIRASICKNSDLSKYSNLVYAEDTLMALVFLANSKNGINFVDEHDFVWRQVEGSGSHGGFSDRANQTEFYEACLDIFHQPKIYSIVSQNSPLISIIIPVYNVEKYLRECLDSVVNQTYKNIEIIVVNDGATDKSQQIIDEYKSLCPDIIAIEQKNRGLNMARAAGAKLATGRLIAFIDSDDIAHQDYLKILYENLLTNDVDISVCGFKVFSTISEISNHEQPKPNYSEQVIKDKRGAVRYYLGDITSVPNVHQMTAWGKLYKAQIIKATDWEISNYKRHEDNLESIQWYALANKGVSVLSTPLYFYRKNPDSITQSLKKNVSPDGRELNYFEFIRELYIKIKSILNDESYDLALINQFANINLAQARNYFMNEQLDKMSMDSASENWGKIISLYTEQIQAQTRIIQELEKSLTAINDSFSWRITKPLRDLNRLLKKLVRTIHK